MTMTNSIAKTNSNDVTSDFDDMFSDLPELDAFDVKKEYIGADLAALLAFSGVSKSVLAEELGWHKSAVTRLFSGKCNPTAKTIWSLSNYLGFDFDIAFRKHDQASLPQPWHACTSVSTHVRSVHAFSPLIFVKVQTPEEVKTDISNGVSVYVSFTMPEVVKMKTISSTNFLLQELTSPRVANTMLLNNNMSRATLRAK
jgi:transcriptional regulator with XRE-family HTH domain